MTPPDPELRACQGLGLNIPPCDSEYPGYLRVLYLIQQGTQSSTPKTSQIEYFLTEALMLSQIPWRRAPEGAPRARWTGGGDDATGHGLDDAEV